MRSSVLEINGISKTFDGTVDILRNVSFSLFENEVVGTLGLLPSNKLFESIALQFADAQRQALY